MKWSLGKVIDKLTDIVLWLCVCVVFWVAVQVFCFAGFKVPTDSMIPVLQPGDRIVVNKGVQGARLFNVFAALRGEDIAIYRLPGWGKVKRNDVVVFNFPYADGRWDSIRFDVMQYYVKRCIALPGDTIEIRNGYYKVRGYNGTLGDVDMQRCLSHMENPEEMGIYTETYPWNKYLGWNIREFGPLPVPKEGQLVVMDSIAYCLYKPLIAWEQKDRLELHGNTVCLGDSAIKVYRFKKNYYFVAGDQVVNSQDSRYWGMLPEEFIVGKATRIWYSEDKRTGETRWHRVMKAIK